MSARATLRRSLPYAVVTLAGFLSAYLLVAFAVFPSGLVPGNARVPDVKGLSFEDAGKRLAGLGFQAKRGMPRFNTPDAKGTVLDQDPRPGTPAEEGASVSLVVSGGDQIVAVPPVVGLTEADARTALEASGFEVGQIVEQPSPGPPGQVLASTPPAGTRLAIPSTVSIVIGVGATVALVPNVVGRSVRDARQVLRSARLAPAVSSPGSTAVGDGEIVTGQSPAAGARVATGSRVTLQIGIPPGGHPK